MGEAGLAELPEEHETAGQTEVLVRVQALQLLAAEGAELFDYLGDGVAGGELVGIGIDPLVSQLLEFLQTLLTDLVG